MRVMKAISDGNLVQHLYFLLEFLAAWEKRPWYLTRMAYEWCSAISEVAGKLGQGEIPIIEPRPTLDKLESRFLNLPMLSPPPGFSLQFRLGQNDLVFYQGPGLPTRRSVEEEFSKVGPGCDPVRLGDTSHRTLGDSLESPTPIHYAQLLSITLQIGFRLESPRGMPIYSRDHTPDYDWMFETAFSSRDDEVVADAICAYVTKGCHTPLDSFARHFSKRIGSDTPFSPRLRRISIHAIEVIWLNVREGLMSEAVRWLDHLSVGKDDVEHVWMWGHILVDVVCSPTGFDSLSSHYWDLLDKLTPHARLRRNSGPRGMEVMRSLEKAEDWWKLEVWVLVMWRAPLDGAMEEEVRRVTLELLLQRPSALPRFENLRKAVGPWKQDAEGTVIEELQRICDQVRTEQSPSESSPPYVYFRLTQHPSVLMPPFPPLQSTDSGAAARPPPFCRRPQFLNLFIILPRADFQSGRFFRWILSASWFIYLIRFRVDRLHDVLIELYGMNIDVFNIRYDWTTAR